MTTGDALLAEVLRTPDEDAPRLVYADWLTENGREERAAFIRVQCELATRFGLDPNGGPVVTGDRKADRDEVALRRRERELATSGIRSWCPVDLGEHAMRLGCPSQAAGNGWELDFTRGFIHSVTCSAREWLAAADKVVAAHPVQQVTLTTFPTYDWQMSNLPDGWPIAAVGTAGGRQYIAADALSHRWPRITFHLPPEPRRDQNAHWNPVTLEARPLVAPMRLTEEMLRDMNSGYNFGDAVMAAWQREMGIPLPPDDPLE